MVLSKFANKSFFTRLISGIILVALILVTIIPGGNILFFFNMYLFTLLVMNTFLYNSLMPANIKAVNANDSAVEIKNSPIFSGYLSFILKFRPLKGILNICPLDNKVK